MKSKNLSDIITDYPQDHPQTLAALLDADPAQLHDERAWALRHQALNVARSWEQHFVAGPWDVLEMIVSGYVFHPWESAWKSYALSADRQPILVPEATGRTRYLSRATRLLPKPEDLGPLPKAAPGSRGASWLVVYGGVADEILAKAGVKQGLIRLAKSVPVADIVFYDKQQQGQPTLWSIRAGTGVAGVSRAGAQEIHFTQADEVAEIRSHL